MIITKQCEFCGNDFYIDLSGVESRHKGVVLRKRFCGRKCQGLHLSKKLKDVGHSPQKCIGKDGEKKRLEAMRSEENKEFCRNKMRELHKVCPKTKKHSSVHIRANHFVVRSPFGADYVVHNMAAFIWKNKHLFDPDDVEVRSYGQSRAQVGFHSIYRGHRMSWKGWVKVCDISNVTGETEQKRN